jgi:tetratricopeptide (TPR) repeat protein
MDSEGSSLDAGTMTQTTRGRRPLPPVKVEPGTPLSNIQETFNRITGNSPPAEWRDSDNLADIIARWNINYSHYLVDRGDYRQAAELLLLAQDLASVVEIEADTMLELGTIYSRFLKEPEQALAEYRTLLQKFPQLPQAEKALYFSAQVYSDLGESAKAEETLERYISRYPAGIYFNNAETLLRSLRQAPPRPTGR